MSRESCPECGVRPDLHTEIEAALSDGALEAGERADLARDALRLAPQVPAQRRIPALRSALVAAVAAAVLLYVAWPGRTGRPVNTAADIVEARAANDRALAQLDWGRLGNIPEGSFAVIARGRLIGISKDLPKLFELAPGAAHRYVFPVGKQGDVTYETALPEPASAGEAFFTALGMKLSDAIREGSGWQVYGLDRGPTCYLDVGEPYGRRERSPILIAAGYSGPLVLPEGTKFPRFEIPGTARLVDRNGRGRRYRRYTVGVGYSTRRRDDFQIAHYALVEGLGEPVAAERIEPDVVPELDLEWARVPAGPFQFGPTGRTYELELEEFEILKYEVTNGQWYYYLFEQWEYLNQRGRYLAAVPRNWGWEDPRRDEPPPFPPPEMWDKPVVFITWYQAQEFCTEWLAKQEGCSGARLPSRYEWEKAARGPKDDRPYPWGKELYRRSERDRYRCNVSVPGIMVATEVARYFRWDSSPYGAVGMAGNVSEFVGGATWQGYRGGSFSDHPDDVKLYIETTLAPGSDHSWNYVGFRPARSIRR